MYLGLFFISLLGIFGVFVFSYRYFKFLNFSLFFSPSVEDNIQPYIAYLKQTWPNTLCMIEKCKTNIQFTGFVITEFGRTNNSNTNCKTGEYEVDKIKLMEPTLNQY